MVCGRCDFIGDALELYATVSKQPLAAATAELVVEGILSFDEDPMVSEEMAYLRQRALNRQAIDCWKTGSAWVVEGLSSSIEGVLQTLGCFQHQNDRKRWSKIFGVFTKEELGEITDEFNEGKRTEGQRIAASIGRYHVIGIPCWSGSTLAGLWLIHPKALDAGFAYLPLQHTDTALGLGHLTRATDEQVIITNDPRVALRFMLRQLWDTQASGTITPFVCPKRAEDQPVDTGARTVTYFPTEVPLDPSTNWLSTAIRTLGSQVIMTWTMKQSPLQAFPTGTVAVMMRALLNLAVPAHQALGAYLLTQPIAQASRLAASMELPIADQSEVRSFFTGDDAITLDRLFGSHTKNRQIDFNGKRVMESKRGWTCRELLITNVMIHISQSETNKTTGKTRIMGTVSGDGKLVHFAEDLDVIRKDVGGWLERKAHTDLQVWPKIDRSWARHLLSLAYDFSKDTAKMLTSDRPFGWSESVLRFPRFTIDGDGVHRVSNQVFGPNVLPPEQPTPADFDTLSDLNTCLVSLALLGNLMRTQQGLHGLGIVVPSAPHVVARLSDSLGLELDKNPSIQAVMLSENRPLPILGAWSDSALAELLQTKGPKNIFTSLDAKSFRLISSMPNWIRLPIDNLSTYDVRWIYHAVPKLLHDLPKVNTEFFTSIATTIIPWVRGHNASNVLLTAAHRLDRDLITTNDASGAGNRFLFLLRELHLAPGAQALHVETRGSHIVIQHADVIRACASPVLPPVDIAAMTKVLAESGMLQASDKTSWSISDTLWAMIGSYIKVQS